MWFNQYPYINLTDLNLDNLYKSLKELRYQLENFININTIKYANPIQWNITTQYEANTVVIDANDGTAYLSVKPVPSGVAITNTDYWTPIFTLNLLSANQNITLRDDGSNTLATFTSAVDDWLIWNGVLYKVTRAIAVNEAYLVGYNLTRYSVELFISDAVSAINSTIGELNNLNTSDKTNIVNAINSIIAMPSNFKFVEDFGAIGDGVTDDTQAFLDAFDYGKTNKCLILANARNTNSIKQYVVSADLEIEDFIFDCCGASIITANTITLNGYGSLLNCDVDGGNVILKNGHNRINNVALKNFDGIGLEMDASDFESFVSNIRILTTLKLTTIGIKFGGSDTSVHSVYGYAPHTGIVFSGNNNYLYDCHLWVRNPEFLGSTFCKYSHNNNHIIGGFSDTYQYCLEPQADALNFEFSNCSWFNNSNQVSNSHFYLVTQAFNNNRIYGDVTINLTGFAAAGNELDTGSISFLEPRFINVGNVSALTKRTDLYYSDIADLLGITSYTGSGNIQYGGGFIKSDIILYFNSDRKTSLPYTDLRPSLILPQNLKRHKLLIPAVYYDTVNSSNVNGYMILDFASGTMTFTIPTEFASYEISSISLEFVLSEF